MEKPKKISAFPVGDKLPETFSKYFVGQAYLARLTRNGALNWPDFERNVRTRMPQQLA